MLLSRRSRRPLSWTGAAAALSEGPYSGGWRLVATRPRPGAVTHVAPCLASENIKRKSRMRVSTMIRIRPPSEQNGANRDSGLMDRITDFARQVEARAFPGIWVGDSVGRGRPTLDSLQVLSAIAAVTQRVDLGIAVLQLPLRNPIELAHRVQSLQAISNDRLILGVGSGSTRDDFELLGYDYDHLCRQGSPGLDPVRPVQQLGRSRIWNEDLSRGRRHQCRPRQLLDRPRRASPIRRAGEGGVGQFHLPAGGGAPAHQTCRAIGLRGDPDRLAIRRDRGDRARSRLPQLVTTLRKEDLPCRSTKKATFASITKKSAPAFRCWSFPAAG